MAVIAPDGRLLRTNDAIGVLLGVPREDLLGRSFVTLLDPLERVDMAEHLRGLIASELSAYQVDCHLRHVSGRSISVRMSVARIAAGDHGPAVVVAQIEDIAARQARDRATAALQGELNRSNEELTAFASIAAHDLQEPLRKIRAFGDRLETRYGDALGTEGRDYLSRMRNAAERMQLLINDLLTYARVASHPQPFERVELDALVESVRGDLETRISESGGRVEVAPLPTIDGDPKQLRQVFQNLISNGLKFAAAARPPVVRIRLEPGTDDSVSIVVTDNGIGFDPEYRERIFAPFERLHGREEYEGTGMGLAICRRIVERHGGSIDAEGRPGEGSSFRMTLPLSQTAT
jgi:PAS domain S-box-containing protein